MSRVLFAGLGKMGFHMSGYLSKTKSINLSIFNRTSRKEKIWKKNFSAETYNFISQNKFDFVITCLKDDKAINNFFEKFIKTNNYHKNTIVIDHSTISLDQVKILKKKFRNKLKFLDAPISGGEEGAKKGTLTVMIGGNKKIFEKSKKLISVYSKNITYIGNSGKGQLAKFTNQILICGILYSISEAYLFSKKNKIDQNKIYNALKNGAAGSWQFQNRYPTIVKNKFNFGFSTELMVKDLNYVLKQAKLNSLNLILTKKVLSKYKKLLNTKYKNRDTSSLIKTF
tara:strand:- start:614 stop:1465 length:852 start_codon:yes stop_codon:yes gene_type:complete